MVDLYKCYLKIKSVIWREKNQVVGFLISRND
jgi:hypothetical protein